jgi:hypothetical protein
MSQLLPMWLKLQRMKAQATVLHNSPSHNLFVRCLTPRMRCFCPCFRTCLPSSAAHMFDRTSVIMLCMMTIAFLIPCVLSYVPALRMLQGSSGFSSLTPGRSTSRPQHRAAYSPSAVAAGGTWAAYSTGSTYTGVIPPRPAARVRPGTSPVS